MNFNDDQANGTGQSQIPEIAETPNPRPRKGSARLSPRKVSPLTRQLILDEFRAKGDMDEIAKTYRLPVRTIDSILHWHALRIQPQPARSLGLVPARRTA